MRSVFLGLAAFVVLVFQSVGAVGDTVIDLTENTTTGGDSHLFVASGVIFEKVSTADAAGTGVFPSFVAFGGNDPVTYGYNTDANPATDPKWTAYTDNSKTVALALAAVPIVSDAGTDYFEFRLDVNEAAEKAISLDQVQLFLTDTADLGAASPQFYDTLDLALERFDGDAYKFYDLDAHEGDTTFLMESWAPGGGKGDYQMLVPVAMVSAAATSSGFSTYLVLYSEVGGAETLPMTVLKNEVKVSENWNFGNSDGFEEWGTVEGITGTGTPEIPAPSALVGLLSMGVMGLLGLAWRRRRRAA